MEKITYLIVFLLYMAVMIGVGFFFYRRKLSVSDYFLGGRKLNPAVTAMSAQASDMSGWLLTGLPGLAFISVVGGKEAIWTAIGLAIGTLLNWLFVAKRLRVYTEISGNSMTIPSFFENRFKDEKGVLSIVTGIVLLIFFTFYTASMFYAGAKLFSSVFGINYYVSLILGIVVIVSYTFMGGFLAVSWTDLFQGILMFCVLIIMPIVMLSSATPIQNETIMNSIKDVFSTKTDPLGAMAIIAALAWGLGYFGMPHILIRFMAIRDKKDVKSATAIAMFWVVLSMAGALAVGVFAKALFPHLSDSETVFMESVKTMFSPIIAGIFLSAVLAAIMSTADSQLLVASSAFANDVYKRIKKGKVSDKKVLMISRMSVIVVSALALLVTIIDKKGSVFSLVAFAWAGLGSAFGPTVLFGLYSKKITLKGAVSSIVTGALVCIAFKFILAPTIGQYAKIFAIYEIVPGFLSSTIVLWVVSLMDKVKNPKIEAEFNEMLSKLK